jgi:hypothetical protein
MLTHAWRECRFTTISWDSRCYFGAGILSSQSRWGLGKLINIARRRSKIVLQQYRPEPEATPQQMRRYFDRPRESRSQ